MTKILVTGGAGFIGSNLCRLLVGKCADVVALDDLSTGKLDNLAGLNMRTVVGSVLDMDVLHQLCSEVDIVFHLAALPSAIRSIEYPKITHEVNATGTLNVLVASRDGGVKRFVYASSSSVYGDAVGLPKREGIIPNPISPYGASKLAGEHYCNVFNKAYGLSTVCLRLFNVYGINQNAKSEYAAVIPKFIDSLKNDTSPVIYGDGEQTRDFTHVDDAVRGFVMAAESDVGGTFNIAGGVQYGIKNLALFLALELGKDIKPEYQDARIGDIRHSLASIDRAKRFLGYRPQYNLADGLRKLLGDNLGTNGK